MVICKELGLAPQLLDSTQFCLRPHHLPRIQPQGQLLQLRDCLQIRSIEVKPRPNLTPVPLLPASRRHTRPNFKGPIRTPVPIDLWYWTRIFFKLMGLPFPLMGKLGGVIAVSLHAPLLRSPSSLSSPPGAAPTWLMSIILLVGYWTKAPPNLRPRQCRQSMPGVSSP